MTEIEKENIEKFKNVCPEIFIWQLWEMWVEADKHLRDEYGIRLLQIVDFCKGPTMNDDGTFDIHIEKLAVESTLWIPSPELDELWDSDDKRFTDNPRNLNLKYYIRPSRNFAPTPEIVRNTYTEHQIRICNEKTLPPLFKLPTDLRKSLPFSMGYTVDILSNEWREPEYTWPIEAIMALETSKEHKQMLLQQVAVEREFNKMMNNNNG